MSWFSKSVSNTKSSLQEIESLSIQNRIDGDRGLKEVTQYAQTINNYFGTQKPKRHHTESDNTHVDIELDCSVEEYIEQAKNGNYYNEYTLYCLEESGYNVETHRYQLENGDNSTASPIEYFNSTPELIAKYGYYENMEKGITIEDKVKNTKSSWFRSGLDKKTLKEIEIANNARAILREEDERARTKQAEQFKRKTEEQMRLEAERAEKGLKVKQRADAMMDMAKREREANAKMYEEKNNNLLDEIKGLMAGIAQPRQLSEKAIVDEIMSRFNKPQDSYIDTKVLAR